MMMKLTPRTLTSGTLYAAYLLLALSAACTMNTNFADDAYIKGLLAETSPSSFWNLYTQWSSRLLSQATLFALCASPVSFKMLTFITFAALPPLLQKLPLDLKQENLGTVALICLLYPLGDMQSAGWISTLANYFYPFVAGLLCVCLMGRVLHGNTLSRPQGIALFVLLLFAANHEQGLAIMLCVILAFMVIYYKKYRVLSRLYAGCLALAVLLAVAFVAGPGTQNRLNFEIASHLPDFAYFSMAYKAYLGFMTTAYRYFFAISIPALVFFFALGHALFAKYRNVRGAWLFFLPCAFPLSFQSVVMGLGLHPQPYLDTAQLMSPLPYVYLGLGIFFVLMTLYFVYAFAGWSRIFCLIGLLLTVGFGSRMLLGFSPVVFVSGTRPSLFADMALLISTLVLLTALSQQNRGPVLAALACGALVQTIHSVLLF